MSLEQRGGRVYYYDARRVNGRVVKTYAGSGNAAALLARFDALDREHSRLKAADRRRRDERTAATTAKLRKWLARVDAVVGGAMTAAGWHRPKRGEWRKKRGATMTTLAPTTDAAPSWVSADLRRVAGELDPAVEAKAAKGDRSVADAVAAFLDRPAAVALYGDIGRHVLLRWVRRYAGDNLLLEGALMRQAADLRERLAGPSPSAVELLVAERVVLAWVFAGWAEYQYAALVHELSVKQAEHQLRRMEMANRHLLSACKTLAKVRRARLPEVLALVNLNPMQSESAHSRLTETSL